MKKIILLFIVSVSFLTMNAQEWITDFDQAREIAAKENKKIILVFQGSDWCAPCIKLEKEIFTTVEFNEFATDNFVMLKADFPRRKKNKLSEVQQTKNENLAEMYNKRGHFPLVVVLNDKGIVLGTKAYEKVKPLSYAKQLAALK